MAETRSITCDQCERELITHSKYPAEYSLELKAINTNINSAGAVYSVRIVPPFDGTKHFCTLECLKGFLK